MGFWLFCCWETLFTRRGHIQKNFFFSNPSAAPHLSISLNPRRPQPNLQSNPSPSINNPRLLQSPNRIVDARHALSPMGCQPSTLKPKPMRAPLTSDLPLLLPNIRSSSFIPPAKIMGSNDMKSTHSFHRHKSRSHELRSE